MTPFFAFLIFLSPLSHAEAPVTAAFLQMQHNVTCKFSVTKKEVNDYKAGACTQHNGDFKKLPNFGQKVLDVLVKGNDHTDYARAVFKDAANLQVDKNQCLEQQVQCLKGNEDAFKDWYRFLATSWLSVRKAALILEQCAYHGTTELSAKEVYEDGFDKAYAKMRESWPLQRQKSTPQIEGHIKDYCSRPEMTDTLATAIEVLQQAMPFVSDEKFFSTLEGHRGSIISKKTGKPITDEEILMSDLSDPGKLVRTDLTGKDYSGAKKDIQDRFDLFVNNRKKMNEAIARAGQAKYGNFPLPESVQRDLFNDGSVHQVLAQKNQIPEGYTDLEHTPRGTVNPGAVCLLSHFEYSPLGAAGDFGFTSVLFGGLAKRLFTGTKYIGKHFIDKTSQFGAGAAIGGAPIAVHQAYGVCLQDKRNMSFNGSAELERKRNEGKYNMPDSLGYRADEKWGVKKCPVAAMPACEKLKGQKVTLSSISPNVVDCLKGIAEGNIPLPMKIMLPMEMMR